MGALGIVPSGHSQPRSGVGLALDDPTRATGSRAPLCAFDAAGRMGSESALLDQGGVDSGEETGRSAFVVTNKVRELAAGLRSIPIPCAAAALTVAYPLMQPTVLALIRKTLSGKGADGYSPEEIADEAWLRMYERRATYHRHDHEGYDAIREARMLRSWILTCAQRVAIDRLRRNRALRAVPISSMEESLFLEAAGTYEDDLTRRDTARLLAQISKASEEIDPLAWRMLRRQMRGDSIDAIREHYGLTYSQVKARLAALRRKLRERFPVAS